MQFIKYPMYGSARTNVMISLVYDYLQGAET